MKAGVGRRASRGFTLMELLIVVALASILVAIAVPAYQDYTRSARRSDAVQVLLDAANRQQRYFADNEVYTATLTDLGYPADPATSRDGFYRLTAALTADGYVLTATPTGVQASDTECGALTYDALGRRGAGGAGDCWP